MPYWLDEETELFKQAWSSGKYDSKTMEAIFQRSFDALRAKAQGLGLDTWETVEGRVRLIAIRKALTEEHLI